MNPNGNPKIGNTQKYGKFVREQIGKIIRKEWNQVKNNPPSAEEFAERVKKVMHAQGIKSPDGSELTLRGVKYQVQRCGITFKGRISRMKERGGRQIVIPSPATIEQTVQRFEEPVKPAPAETKEERQEIMKSLSAIPLALQGVLEDETLTPIQRRKMFEAYFELNK